MAEARAALLRSCDKIRESCGQDVGDLLGGIESEELKVVLSTCEAAVDIVRAKAAGLTEDGRNLLDRAREISTDADDVTAAVALVREKKEALNKSKAEREAKKREARTLLRAAAVEEMQELLEEDALLGLDHPQQLAAVKIEHARDLGAASTGSSVVDIGSEENQENTQQQHSAPAVPALGADEGGSSGAARTASTEQPQPLLPEMPHDWTEERPDRTKQTTPRKK